MHDVSNYLVPQNIQDLFLPTSRVHSCNTRSATSHNFYVKTSKLEIPKYGSSRTGAKLWNEIPTNIHKLRKDKFNKRIRAFLFEILESDSSYYGLEEIISKVN